MSDAVIRDTPRTRLLPALVGGAAATAAGGLVLGVLQGSTGDKSLELGYWALALGLLVGAAVGRAGERARTAALVAVPLALIGVLLTQLTGAAVHIGAADPSAAYDFWRAEVFGKNDMMFYLVAAIEGYLVAQRVAELRS